MLTKRNALITVAALGCVFTTACNKAATAPAAEAKTAKSADTADDNPMEIKAAPALLSQLKLGQPKWGEVSGAETVAARVEIDETRTTRVGSRLMGRITAVFAHEGELVKKGQILASMNSGGLSDTQLSLLKALLQRQVAQRAVERAKLLLKADVIGVAELQRREAELEEVLAEAEAARDQLKILGMTPEAVAELERTRAMNSASDIPAPADGTILLHNIRPGQVVQPADTVFEVADLTAVWLVADVPEQSAGALRVGQSVEAEISALPGLKIRGALSFVSATVNPETRTIRVRMNVPNPSGRYKPAMLATMTIRGQFERRLLVPASAVVREDDKPHVFIRTAPDTFVLRPIVVGDEHTAGRVVQEGLSESDSIVLDGSFHLNNERRRRLLRGSEGE